MGFISLFFKFVCWSIFWWWEKRNHLVRVFAEVYCLIEYGVNCFCTRFDITPRWNAYYVTFLESDFKVRWFSFEWRDPAEFVSKLEFSLYSWLSKFNNPLFLTFLVVLTIQNTPWRVGMAHFTWACRSREHPRRRDHWRALRAA